MENTNNNINNTITNKNASQEFFPEKVAVTHCSKCGHTFSDRDCAYRNKSESNLVYCLSCHGKVKGEIATSPISIEIKSILPVSPDEGSRRDTRKFLFTPPHPPSRPPIKVVRKNNSEVAPRKTENNDVFDQRKSYHHNDKRQKQKTNKQRVVAGKSVYELGLMSTYVPTPNVRIQSPIPPPSNNVVPSCNKGKQSSDKREEKEDSLSDSEEEQSYSDSEEEAPLEEPPFSPASQWISFNYEESVTFFWIPLFRRKRTAELPVDVYIFCHSLLNNNKNSINQQSYETIVRNNTLIKNYFEYYIRQNDLLELEYFEKALMSFFYRDNRVFTYKKHSLSTANSYFSESQRQSNKHLNDRTYLVSEILWPIARKIAWYTTSAIVALWAYNRTDRALRDWMANFAPIQHTIIKSHPKFSIYLEEMMNSLPFGWIIPSAIEGIQNGHFRTTLFHLYNSIKYPGILGFSIRVSEHLSFNHLIKHNPEYCPSFPTTWFQIKKWFSKVKNKFFSTRTRNHRSSGPINYLPGDGLERILGSSPQADDYVNIVFGDQPAEMITPGWFLLPHAILPRCQMPDAHKFNKTYNYPTKKDYKSTNYPVLKNPWYPICWMMTSCVVPAPTVENTLAMLDYRLIRHPTCDTFNLGSILYGVLKNIANKLVFKIRDIDPNYYNRLSPIQRTRYDKALDEIVKGVNRPSIQLIMKTDEMLCTDFTKTIPRPICNLSGRYFALLGEVTTRVMKGFADCYNETRKNAISYLGKDYYLFFTCGATSDQLDIFFNDALSSKVVSIFSLGDDILLIDNTGPDVLFMESDQSAFDRHQNCVLRSIVNHYLERHGMTEMVKFRKEQYTKKLSVRINKTASNQYSMPTPLGTPLPEIPSLNHVGVPMDMRFTGEAATCFDNTVVSALTTIHVWSTTPITPQEVTDEFKKFGLEAKVKFF